MEIDVKEASRRLGLNDSRVRQLLRAGDLRGRRLGGSWLVDGEDVARLQGRVRLPGRPLAPKRAWAVLDLLDGGRAAWLSDSARSQVRRHLADLVDPGPDEWMAALRRRSRVLDVVAHPAAIERLRLVDGVHPAGPSAALGRGFDLVAMGESMAEFYVAEAHWPDLYRALALSEGREPNLRVHLPREVWPFADEDHRGRVGVGDAVLAAGLLESAEPRAVAAGADRLGDLLARWHDRRARG